MARGMGLSHLVQAHSDRPTLCLGMGCSAGLSNVVQAHYVHQAGSQYGIYVIDPLCMACIVSVWAICYRPTLYGMHCLGMGCSEGLSHVVQAHYVSQAVSQYGIYVIDPLCMACIVSVWAVVKACPMLYRSTM